MNKPKKNINIESELNSEDNLKLLDDFKYAIIHSNLENVEYLDSQILEKIKSLNTQDFYNNSLLLASQVHNSKSLKIMKYILQRGANPNTFDKMGNTPLHLVINKTLSDADNKIKMISLLVEFGAHLNQKNNEGNLPQHFVFNHKNHSSEKILKFLITKNINLEATGVNGYTLLHFAVQDEKAVQILLNHGVMIDPIDINGATPLFWAAFYGNLKSTQILIKGKAEINWAGFDNRTPLFNAFLEEDHFEIFKVLLENGANIVALDKDGKDLFSQNMSPNLETQALYEQKKLEMRLPENKIKGQTLRL